MVNEPKFLNTNFLHGSEIYFVMSKIEKEYPLHFHEFYEIELPIEGEGYEIINGVRHEIDYSTIFLFHPTDYHQIFATKPITMYNIAFTNSVIDEEIISNFLNYESGIVIELSENKLNQIKTTIKLIQEIFDSHRSNKEDILSHLLNALLLIIIGSKQTPEAMESAQSPIVSVLKYIHENYSSNPTLQELSDYCGYQRNYFCDYFKKKTGFTYKDYLSNIKINASKRLLKITNKSIKEIALECGFNSVNNFIRKFKIHAGITPMQYHKLYLETKK